MSLYGSRSSANSKKVSLGYQWQERGLQKQLVTEPGTLSVLSDWILAHENFLQVTDPHTPHRRMNSKRELDQPYSSPWQVYCGRNPKSVLSRLSSMHLSCLHHCASAKTISPLALAHPFPAPSYLPSNYFCSLLNLSSGKENLQQKKKNPTTSVFPIREKCYTSV